MPTFFPDQQRGLPPQPLQACSKAVADQGETKKLPEPGVFHHALSHQSSGPAVTKALPASFPVNLLKFLMKRSDKSFALVSHSPAWA